MLIDFSKAYDRVNRDLLYVKMAIAGINEETINYVKSIHLNTKVVIGEEKFINTGVPQGSVILFNIYIDDLLKELEKVNTDFWAYADDIAFDFRNAKEYHQKFEIIEGWAMQNGMKINDKKCRLMIVNNIDLNSKYSVVDVIKYLRIKIKKNLTLNEYYKTCKKKWK